MPEVNPQLNYLMVFPMLAESQRLLIAEIGKTPFTWNTRETTVLYSYTSTVPKVAQLYLQIAEFML